MSITKIITAKEIFKTVRDKSKENLSKNNFKSNVFFKKYY